MYQAMMILSRCVSSGFFGQKQSKKVLPFFLQYEPQYMKRKLVRRDLCFYCSLFILNFALPRSLLVGEHPAWQFSGNKKFCMQTVRSNIIFIETELDFFVIIGYSTFSLAAWEFKQNYMTRVGRIYGVNLI